MRPITLAALLAAGAALVGPLAGPAAAQQAAAVPVDLTLRDAHGGELAAVTAAVRDATTGELAAEWTPAIDGTVGARLAPGTYTATWYHGGVTWGAHTWELSGPLSESLRFDLYPFRLNLSASNGDRLVGARVRLSGARGFTMERPVEGGLLRGHAPAGEVRPALIWTGVRTELNPFDLPDLSSQDLEVPMHPLSVRLEQAGSGIGFGPVLIALASEGEAWSDGMWSDHGGALDRMLPPGEVRVLARWFDREQRATTSIPGELTVGFDLATKAIPPPADGPIKPFLAQVRQPDFSIWATGQPEEGIRLPLPPGRYDVVLYNDRRQPTFGGVATVDAEDPTARIQWGEAGGAAAGALAERRLNWPRSLMAEPPSAAVREAGTWQPLPVQADGALGPMPRDMAVRVPDNVLGREYQTNGTVIEVQLGLLELKLPRPGRVKLIDPANPDRFVVTNCAAASCAVPLPPGRYLVLAPDTQLVREPVTVTAGGRRVVELKAL